MGRLPPDTGRWTRLRHRSSLKFRSMHARQGGLTPGNGNTAMPAEAVAPSTSAVRAAPPELDGLTSSWNDLTGDVRLPIPALTPC